MNEDAEDPAPEVNGDGGAAPAEAVTTVREFGLDVGLARLIPEFKDLQPVTYRRYRRKLEIFQNACASRGAKASAEGALAVLNTLEGVAWDATEAIPVERFEQADPFNPFFDIFDELYHFDETQEVPARIEELTSRFVRQKDEPLRKFVTRLDTIVARLQAVHCDFPDQYLGHILLTRAAIPDWQVPTARSQITGPLDREKVRRVLYHMFGPDHVPNSRDVARATKSMGDEALAAEFDLDEANSYGSPSFVEWDAEESHFEGEEEPEEEDYEEETPPELEAAARQTEEAYTTWVEARRQMNDLARARGFFPVSQTLQYFKPPTSDSSSPTREPKGRGKGKKGSRSRGATSTGKGGTRSLPTSAAAPPPTTTSPTKTTASGSTQQHGPRFKRVRRPDDVHVIEEVEIVQAPAEEETLVVEIGKGAADSGATSSLIGLETWKKLKAEMLRRDPAAVVEEKPTENVSFRRFESGSCVVPGRVPHQCLWHGPDRLGARSSGDGPAVVFSSFLRKDRHGPRFSRSSVPVEGFTRARVDPARAK